jgi:hypothetical protein
MWIFWILVLILLPTGAIAGMVSWDTVLIGWALLVGFGLVAIEVSFFGNRVENTSQVKIYQDGGRNGRFEKRPTRLSSMKRFWAFGHTELCIPRIAHFSLIP